MTLDEWALNAVPRRDLLRLETRANPVVSFIARELDVSQLYAAGLMRGTRKPSDELAVKIARVSGGQVSFVEAKFPSGLPGVCLYPGDPGFLDGDEVTQKD